MKNQKVKIVYSPEEFTEKGFDGEIATFMRENTNTAIVGNNRHVVQFETQEDLRNYCLTLDKN